MAKTKIRKCALDKNYCSKDQHRIDLSGAQMAVYKIMLFTLVFVASAISSVSPIYAQTTKNLEAKYYSTHNRWSNFNTFGGTVIETRTWDKINTRNYNPKGRGDYWSVDIQGYIYIPSNGSYQFRTLSDDGVRLKIDGKTIINNWTLHAPRYDYGTVTLQSGWKPIQLQMYEWGGGTALQLVWRPPNTGGWAYPSASNLSTILPDTTAPTLRGVSISTNNGDSTKATPTDTVTLSFTASETISSPTVTFLSGGASVNGTVTIQNTSANTWTASYTTNPNDTAGPVTYSIAFSDTAGNAGTAVTATNDSSSVAVVIDSDLPTLVSSSPLNGSKSVKLDQNITLKFSEDIIAGSGQIKLFDESEKLIEAFTISSSIISGSTVILNPTKDLKPENSYYIQIPSTALIDAAGNNYAGINNKTQINFTTRKKTPKEAFTEIKDEIGTDMKSNTTKQIRSFATATTAVVTAARSRVMSKRVSSSSSRSSNRSSGATQSSVGGGNSSSATGSSGSGSGSSSGAGSDGTSGENPGGTDTDTETSFDLRSSTRGTNASGQINSVVTSYDGKVTRYSETQFSYTKSENDTETGSASSQIIFEREKSEDLTVGHFIGISVSKNSTVGTKSTDIESTGLQVGVYFVENITEDLFVDGYLAGSLLTNKMEVTTATMIAEADYVSRMGAVGAAVTGSVDVARWEILPTLALDYSHVYSQDAAFEVTFGGGNSNELSSPGTVEQLSLTFSPDFRTSFDYYDGYWAQGSTFSFKPKFTCQRINQGIITNECGQGAGLSLFTQDEDAMKTLSLSLGIDKFAGDTTYSANALYKFEF